MEKLEWEIDLGPDRFDYQLLLKAYGGDIKPTLNTVLKQNVIISAAFPGFDLDLIMYMKFSDRERKIDMYKGSVVLNKLVSLLYLKDERLSPYVHDRDSNDDLNKNIFLVAAQMEAVDSFSDIQVASKSNFPTFAGVQEIEKTILEKFISLPISASPATLSLFFHKGPSPYKNEKDERNGVCQNFYAQPQLNHRKVTDSRFDEILSTCTGETNFDLTTHQVAIIPYKIVTTTSVTPNNIDNPRFKNQRGNFDKHNVTMNVTGTTVTKDQTWARIRNCFEADDAKDELFGHPRADPLTTSLALQVFELFFGRGSSSLLLKLHPNIAEICDSQDGSTRFKSDIILYLLFKLIHVEYKDFNHTDQWAKLLCRLKQGLGLYASSLMNPTSEQELILQCMILTNASTLFRIACLEGNCRHLVATHCLLGLHPNDCGKLQFPDKIVGLKNIKYRTLCQVNHGVRFYDFGLIDLTSRESVEILRQFSGQLQTRAQTLVHTDVQTLIDSWCSYVSIDEENHFGIWNNPEFLVETEDRKKEWYSDKTFKDFVHDNISVAIRFLINVILNESQHAAYLDTYIATVVEESKDKSKPTLSDTHEVTLKYVFSKALEVFHTGYLTRSTTIYSLPLVDLLMLMTHPITGDPDKIPLEHLQQMVQKGCIGYHKFKNPQDLYYPSPSAFIDTDKCPTLPNSQASATKDVSSELDLVSYIITLS